MSTNGYTELATGKSLFRIGEVDRLTDTKPFVLRYWETEFPMLQPVKSPKGHRLYRREDVETVRHIKRLLYDEGFTIAGARRHLHEAGNAQPGNAQLADSRLSNTQLPNSQQRAAQHDAVEHVAELSREGAHFSREIGREVAPAENEASPKREEGLFARNQAPAPPPISHKVLLELRDSLRAFLTLLENE